MRKILPFTVRSTAAILAAVLCAGGSYGCYTLVPSSASLLAPGKPVALDLNDLGRLNLSPLIGPEVRRLSGVLVAQTNSDFVVRVNEITFLNQRTAEWSGEAVRVRADYVTTVLEEKLSPGRTALAVLGGAGVVGGLLAAKLGGNTAGSAGSEKVPPGGTSNRGIQ